jgi:hypothetical protein
MQETPSPLHARLYVQQAQQHVQHTPCVPPNMYTTGWMPDKHNHRPALCRVRTANAPAQQQQQQQQSLMVQVVVCAVHACLYVQTASSPVFL